MGGVGFGDDVLLTVRTFSPTDGYPIEGGELAAVGLPA